MADGLGDTISRNIISNNGAGIMLAWAENNTISGNTIINNAAAIWLRLDTLGNTIVDNVIANNSFCFDFFQCWHSSNDTIYHNNFISNKHLVANLEPWSNPAWDNGYPSGGNYWSDYNGKDLYSGPYQNETGSDGIGDTPHVIFAEINAQDNYPLMTPHTPTYDLAILNVTTSKTIVGQGYSLPIEITTENQGSCTELLFVTAYANTTTIAESGPVTLAPGKQVKLVLFGDTTDVPKGNYTITAYVHQVPGETDLIDNTLADSIVLVTVPGDVNGDCIVDMADIGLIIWSFMAPPYTPKWNPNHDVNCDWMIDMADVSIAIENFMKTCANS